MGVALTQWLGAAVPKTSRYPLLVACVRALFWELVLPVLPRLCFIGFSFSRPFLMQRVIDTVSEGGTSKEVVNGLIGATILIFGGIMVCILLRSPPIYC